MKIYATLGALLISAGAYGSAFVTKKDETYMRFTYQSAKAHELVMRNSSKEFKGGWIDKGREIKHQAYTLSAERGITDKTSASMTVTYKAIEDTGNDDKFNGWAEVVTALKRSLYQSYPVFVTGTAAFSAPGSEYNQHQLATPGIGVPEFVLGLATAYAIPAANMMTSLELSRAFRLSNRANDQNRYILSLHYYLAGMVSLGVFGGGVSTDGGIDIMGADGEWARYIEKGSTDPKGDEGNTGMPFPRLNEAYQYGGLSVGYRAGDCDLTLAYTEKDLAGAKNTDINRTWTLSVGTSVH